MWWHVLPRPSFATPPGVGRNQEATKHGPRRIEWRRGTLKRGKGLKSLSSTLAVALLLRIDGKAETDWSYRKGMDLRGTSTTRSLKSFQGAHREMDQLVINHAIHSCSVMLVAIYRIWDIWIQDGLYSMHKFVSWYCIWFACRHADQIAHDAAWCVLCVFVLTCGCRSKKLRFQSETKEVAIEYKQSLQDRVLAKIAPSCNWETAIVFW